MNCEEHWGNHKKVMRNDVEIMRIIIWKWCEIVWGKCETIVKMMQKRRGIVWSDVESENDMK